MRTCMYVFSYFQYCLLKGTLYLCMRHLFEPSPLGYTFLFDNNEGLATRIPAWCIIRYGSTQRIYFLTDAHHQYFSRELEGDCDPQRQRNGEEVPIRLCSVQM